MRSAGRWLTVLLVAAPLGALALLRLGSDDTLAGVTFHAEPVLATGTAREIADEKPVKLTLTWDEADQLVAPAWQGTVTGVAASPGTTLRSGDRIAAINGIERIAFASAPPFYRGIASGQSGKDVAELHRLLVLMGFLKEMPADPETATFATTTAIRALAASIGIEQTVSAFDPAWVAWLPADPFPINTLDLHVGRPAPAPGQPFAKALAPLISAQLSPVGQEPLTLDPSAAWVLATGGATFAIDPASLKVQPEALYALAATIKPGAESAPATVRRETPLKAVAIPSTAVMTGPTGQLCIWTPAGDSYEARTVTLSGARAGVSNAVSGLQSGQQLLANPAQVLEKPQCPSN